MGHTGAGDFEKRTDRKQTMPQGAAAAGMASAKKFKNNTNEPSILLKIKKVDSCGGLEPSNLLMNKWVVSVNPASR